MARLVSALGTLMVIVSLVGFGWLFVGPSPEDLIQGPAKPIGQPAPGPVQRTGPGSAVSVPAIAQSVQSPQNPATPAPALAPYVPDPQVATPIDGVRIPSIGLDSEVVRATLVERGGAITWDVPKFKAGHAQGTAGAGDDGNAVLLGHVSSIQSGNVFKDLDRVRIGDEVVLSSGDRRFVYEVTEIHTVDRFATSLLGTTEKASVSLFTCAGAWLPTIWDYAERLVVRGELRRIL